MPGSLANPFQSLAPTSLHPLESMLSAPRRPQRKVSFDPVNLTTPSEKHTLGPKSTSSILYRRQHLDPELEAPLEHACGAFVNESRTEDHCHFTKTPSRTRFFITPAREIQGGVKHERIDSERNGRIAIGWSIVRFPGNTVCYPPEDPKKRAQLAQAIERANDKRALDTAGLLRQS